VNSSTELTFDKACCLIGNCNFHLAFFFFLSLAVSALKMFDQYKPIRGVKRNAQPTGLSAVRGLGHDSYGIKDSRLHMVGFCLTNQKTSKQTKPKQSPSKSWFTP